MSTPQQPELARSGRSKVTPMPPDQRSAEPTDAKGDAGPVPPGNRPGRRPRRDQDKPQGPPPTPLPRVSRDRRFGFGFDLVMRPAAAAVGVTPWTAWVDLTTDELRIRFGPWSVRTPRANVAAATLTGPYRFVKVAGGPRLSLADRGLTFATNRRAGVCIRFAEPVRGLDPVGLLRHPAVTVTVSEPDELLRLLVP